MAEMKKTTTTTPLDQQTPIITTFSNPKSIRTLSFSNRNNDSYEPLDVKLEEFIIGESRTYKDFIERALDPNQDENAKMYGYARELKPLTQRISDMRGDLVNANQQLAEQLNKPVPPAPEATPEPPKSTPTPEQTGGNQ